PGGLRHTLGTGPGGFRAGAFVPDLRPLAPLSQQACPEAAGSAPDEEQKQRQGAGAAKSRKARGKAMKSKYLLAAAAALCLVACSRQEPVTQVVTPAPGPAPAARTGLQPGSRPNILLIVADDL